MTYEYELGTEVVAKSKDIDVTCITYPVMKGENLWWRTT